MALSSRQVEAFNRNGARWPIDAVGPERAADLLARFLALEQSEGGTLSGSTRQSHTKKRA